MKKIEKIENKIRNRKNEELYIIDNETEKTKQHFYGGKDYVEYDNETIPDFYNNISIHNHPAEKGINTNIGFSREDIEKTIETKVKTDIVTGSKYRHTLTIDDCKNWSKIIWKDVNKTYLKYYNEICDYYYDDVRLEKLNEHEYNIEYEHDVWTRTFGEFPNLEYKREVIN